MPNKVLKEAFYTISLFDCAFDIVPKARSRSWQQLVIGMTNHQEREDKDGRLFSPATFFEGTTRSNANVESVSLLVLDHDDGETLEEIEARLKGIAHTIYSTYSYDGENHKCRVVIPLNRPVAATEWPRVWRKLAHHFGGQMDGQCKEPARMYYLPSCAPGAKRFARAGEGDVLDPETVPDLPEIQTRPHIKRSEGGLQQGRVGDDFNAKGEWDEILAPAGLIFAYRKGGCSYYKREGSQNPHGAKTFPDDGSLYVYTDNVTLLPPGRHDKFGAYTRIKHGGDFAAATKDLSQQGYGDQMPSLASPSVLASDIPKSDPPPPAEVKFYNRTDLGNAERLAQRIAPEMRYCHLWKTWLLWNGKRWVQDTTGGDAAVMRASQIVRAMYTEAGEMDDGPDRKALAKWALSCESRTRILAMVALCTAMEGIGISPDDLDANGWLFNCASGTIDLRTGNLLPHNQADLITKMSPATYAGLDDLAGIETFLQFFTRIVPDTAIQDFLFRFLGSCLVADNQDQALAFLYGKGSNGKTTLLEAMSYVLGDYAVGAPPEMLTVSRSDGGASPELARLKGARMVTVPETEDGKRLAESLVKRLTGGEKIYARAMYRDPFEFEFLAKILMSGNHKPTIRGDDLGIWRRIKMVPFNQTIAPSERDLLMRDKLRMEAAGILSWLVSGCLEWQSVGLGTAEAIEEATLDYRSEMDVLGSFIEECCETDKDATVSAGDVYKAYHAWTENGGEYTISQTKFGRKMDERGYVKCQSSTGTRLYQGIRLRDALGQEAWWNKS